MHYTFMEGHCFVILSGSLGLKHVWFSNGYFLFVMINITLLTARNE